MDQPVTIHVTIEMQWQNFSKTRVWDKSY